MPLRKGQAVCHRSQDRLATRVIVLRGFGRAGGVTCDLRCAVCANGIEHAVWITRSGFFSVDVQLSCFSHTSAKSLQCAIPPLQWKGGRLFSIYRHARHRRKRKSRINSFSMESSFSDHFHFTVSHLTISQFSFPRYLLLNLRPLDEEFLLRSWTTVS